ncbi:transcription antitermination factor NusB [uncultured Anaerococcus sp.]|uniref:transcription antitermination factor NusB n=1 Tax=uncultured Anaerococcus sp. TaxID=293428 RepID=UPI0025F078CD|nr:transcription antitermination factor NusB [uncultured Anaerococcus sp.]
MNRRQQREWVFKLIYQDSINDIKDNNDLYQNHDLSEDETYIIKSINSYKDHYDEIVAKLEDNLSTKFSNISRIAKSIIYLSINEIYYLDIPVSVSINEAVDLAKKYSTNDEYKILNKILGDMVRKDKK